MKLRTNFVVPAGRYAPYLAGIVWLMALVFFTIAIDTAISGYQARIERLELAERLVEVTSRAQKHTDVQQLPYEKLADLKRRVATINSMTGAHGRPLTALLATIESLIPDHVYIVQLQHKSQTGEMRIVAESEKTESLSRFFQKLEESPVFADVLLKRQANTTQGGRTVTQFVLDLKERP